MAFCGLAYFSTKASIEAGRNRDFLKREDARQNAFWRAREKYGAPPMLWAQKKEYVNCGDNYSELRERYKEDFDFILSRCDETDIWIYDKKSAMENWSSSRRRESKKNLPKTARHPFWVAALLCADEEGKIPECLCFSPLRLTLTINNVSAIDVELLYAQRIEKRLNAYLEKQGSDERVRFALELEDKNNLIHLCFDEKLCPEYRRCNTKWRDPAEVERIKEIIEKGQYYLF